MPGRGFLGSQAYIRKTGPPTTAHNQQPVNLVASTLSQRVHRVSCRNQTTAVPEQRTVAPRPITCLGPCCAPATANEGQERIATTMLKMPPRSPRVYPVPCWDPQPEDANPAKRRRLQEPACLASSAQPDLEASARPASKELTSTVVIPTGCAMRLHVEGVDLLLEPEPTSVRRVSLPGHTIILVPEGLQASSQPGQAVFWPAGTQEAPVPDMLQDHHVFALDQGFNGAERYAPCSIWSLKSSTRWPLPSPQLQPLPPSPPPSPQEQTSESPQKPPRPPCKAKRRLF